MSADDTQAPGEAMDDARARRPALHIVRGDATDEEVAALVTVLSAAAASTGTAQGDEAAGLCVWNDPVRILGGPLPHGPTAWRASALPR